MKTSKMWRWLLVVVGIALASPVFASQCPSLMRKIDTAMKTAMLTPAQTDEVKKLRADGERQHKARDHKASVDSLKKAMQILGI